MARSYLFLLTMFGVVVFIGAVVSPTSRGQAVGSSQKRLVHLGQPISTHSPRKDAYRQKA